MNQMRRSAVGFAEKLWALPKALLNRPFRAKNRELAGRPRSLPCDLSQLGFEKLADDLGIGLAAGLLHHLAP